MSYKRSTTFTGYKNRTVDKSEQLDLTRKATALDKQRKETVKAFGQQAANQVTEMQRLSSLESQADQYELQNLSKFSTALRNALDTGARTLGVEYIERKRQEGIDNHRARLGGDEEAAAKTALRYLNTARVDLENLTLGNGTVEVANYVEASTGLAISGTKERDVIPGCVFTSNKKNLLL